MTNETNLKQAVPFFNVMNIEASVRYYVDGLGFKMTNQWTPEGKLRWCRLERGDAAIMLQEFWKDGPHANVPMEKLGVGVSICFLCADALALYREFRGRGMQASKPFVGNNLWVTTLYDPDGYRLEFESETNAPEGTEYTEERI
ncbi:VOC family protein [candidate division KSB1 bacterium]|nr:VOC family protein [candidate division KSB1 bacterium]